MSETFTPNAADLSFVDPIDCLQDRLKLAVFLIGHLWSIASETLLPGKPNIHQAVELYEDDRTEAQRSLSLVGSLAIGIGVCLKYGMRANAGAYETSLRETISELQDVFGCSSTLRAAVYFEESRCRTQAHVDALEEFKEKLSNVARESQHDVNEWRRELRDLSGVLVLVNDRMKKLERASHEVELDLDVSYDGARFLIPKVEKVIQVFTRKMVFGIRGKSWGVYFDTLAADIRDYANALVEWGRAKRSGTEDGTFEPPKHLKNLVGDVNLAIDRIGDDAARRSNQRRAKETPAKKTADSPAAPRAERGDDRQRPARKKRKADEMRQKVRILRDIINEESLDDNGKAITEMLSEAGVSSGTFYKSQQFEDVRSDWKSLQGARAMRDSDRKMKLQLT